MSGTTWFALISHHQARLVRASRTEGVGSPHFEHQAKFEDPWVEKQHGRPSRRSGKNEHSYASQRHEDDEHRRRYASAVVEWLGRQLDSRAIQTVFVFAPDRLLGALRQALPARTRERVIERHGDFAHLDVGQLARQSAITQTF